MPTRFDRRFLISTLVIFVLVLVVAAFLFGSQIITTGNDGVEIQSPQTPATRGPGENPTANPPAR